MKILFLLVISFSCCFAFADRTTLLLVRHGETDWNVEKRIQGHTDNPLNANGLMQAKGTAEKLERLHPDIKAIYSSDLCRALSTARETAERFHLPIEVRSSLREINAGASEGMKALEKIALYKKKAEELDEKYPEKRERWKYTSVPDSETFYELAERIKEELIQIGKTHPHQKVAIFSHGRAIQVLIADIEDRDLKAIDIPNCGIVEIIYDSENPEHPLRLIAF